MSRPSEAILDHLRAPRNAGVLPNPQVIGRADLDGRAPRIAIYLAITGNIVSRATFETFGCGYSIACCSALTELVIGRSIPDCWEISGVDAQDALAGLPPEKQFCADLAVAALHNGLAQWADKAGGNDG